MTESIHLISTFHYDYIYLKGSQDYRELSFRILDRALAMLEREPEWRFTVEQVILLEAYAARYPERLPQLRRFAAEGRLCFAPGMYVMPDMNLIDGESLFLQAKYGKKWLHENLGVEPETCWIADCWGHHAQLPQILTQAGYAGYFFWRCMRREVSRNDFFWLGLDGTGISAHWLAKGYAGLSFPEHSGEKILHAEELAFTKSSAAEIRRLAAEVSAYGSDAPLLLCNGGDFRFPQDGACEVISMLNRSGELPPIRFSTPELFLHDCDRKRLPQVLGEFNAAFQGTYSANIRIKQLLFENRERLLARETLAALTGGAAIPAKQWKELLKHQFHDTICGTVGDAGLKEVLGELEALRAKQTLNGTPAKWFNPTLHARREIVPDAGGRRHLVDFAPLSCRAPEEYPVLPESEEVSGDGEFHNAFFRCRYNAEGRLLSLETPRGKELIDCESPAWFGLPVLQTDNGDNWIFYDSPLAKNREGGEAFACNPSDPFLNGRKPCFAGLQQTVVRRSKSYCEITQKGKISFWRLNFAFTLTITMSEESPLIRFRLEAVPAGKHYRIRAVFPTMLKHGKVHHGIPFGITERSNGEYPAEGFCHLGAQDCGIFLLNRGIPGNNVDETGAMMLSLFRSVAMEYKCDSTGSFSEGVPHTFEYAVLAHDGEECLPEESVEAYLRPLQPASAGSFPDAWGALPPNVRLSALRPHRDGLFLRLYESCGRETAFCLSLPENIRSVRRADGLECPAGNLNDISERRLKCSLRPFEICNLILGF